MSYFDKSKNKLIIYLADLDYFLPGNRYFVPLGIGSITSYCKSIYGDLVDISLFKDPNELIEKVRARPPHILGCSFFMWNENLSLKMIEACKAIDGQIITLIGGASTARNCDRYKETLANNPSLDIIVLDQGEKSFSNVVNRVLEKDFNKELIFSESINGCALRINNTGLVERGAIVAGCVDLNKFLSPYLGGYLDKFLQAGFLALFETVRGCPHQCTYCGGGIGSFLPLSIKDEENVYEELLYISERAVAKGSLMGDTNFGIMGERDLRISVFMSELLQKTGFPELLGYSMTKHQTKISKQVLIKLTEMVGSFQYALQTLTPEVLKNCKRINIPIEMAKELGDMARQSHRPIMVDLIFGLPGESLKSFMKTIDKVLLLGIEYPSIFQLRMLPGTTSAEYEREKYNYKTKFRTISGRYGEYNFFYKQKPTRIVETEEIVCSNNTFDFNDFITMRNFGLIIRLLVGSGAFPDTIFYLSSRGILITEVFRMIEQNYHKYPRLKQLFTDYEMYSKNELFDSKEDLYNQITKDDEQWNDLISNRGIFFKLDLGFVGYCLFDDIGILEDVKEIMYNGVRDRLSSADIEGFNETARHDKLFRMIQNKECGKLIETDIKEEIVDYELYDYDNWRSSDFKGDISNFRLKEKIEKVYYVERVGSFKETIKEFYDLSGYLFYEKIILWGPQSLKRLSKNNI